MSATGCGQEIELLVLDEDKKSKQQVRNETDLTHSPCSVSITNNELVDSLECSPVKDKTAPEPLSIAGVHQLRGVLSEALSTSLFKFAVAIVFIFNLLYSLFNSFRQDDSNDDMATKCRCNGRHKTFYVTIILTSTVVWFLILMLEKFYTWFVHPGRYDHRLLELIKDNLKFESYFIKELNLLLSAVYDDQNNMDKLIGKLKKEQTNRDFTGSVPIFRVHHYLETLFPNVMLTMHSEGYIKKSIFKSSRDNISRHFRQFCRLKCRHKAVASFKLFLIVNQVLAQLLIIPLLELQWLDQYAWVCVAGISRNYCNSDRDVYTLVLDQAVVVYMFYASILFAALLSMIISWLPQYNDKQANV